MAKADLDFADDVIVDLGRALAEISVVNIRAGVAGQTDLVLRFPDFKKAIDAQIQIRAAAAMFRRDESAELAALFGLGDDKISR